MVVETIGDAKDSFSRFLGDAGMIVENTGNGTDAYLRYASDIIDCWGQELNFLEGLPQNQVLIRESQEKNANLGSDRPTIVTTTPMFCT